MIRLMILMAMGLGAMYMLHLLAQDYNRIRRPIPQMAAARAITNALTSASASLMRGKRDIADNHERSLNATTLTIDWKRILSRDPLDCLQSLICQVMAGAEGRSNEAIFLIDFLESTLSLAPAQIGRAFSRGLAFLDEPERCYHQYPLCFYSARTMLRVLDWFIDTSHESTATTAPTEATTAMDAK